MAAGREGNPFCEDMRREQPASNRGHETLLAAPELLAIQGLCFYILHIDTKVL